MELEEIGIGAQDAGERLLSTGVAWKLRSRIGLYGSGEMTCLLRGGAMKLAASVTFTGFLSAFVCGCVSDAYGSALDRSPGDTVRAFFVAANEGNYEEAERHFTTEAATLIKKAGSFRGFCDNETRNRTVESVEIVKEEIRETEAIVQFKVTFKSGLALSTEVLTKQEGVWRMTGTHPAQIRTPNPH